MPQFQMHDEISASVALRKGIETGCSGNVVLLLIGFQEFLNQESEKTINVACLVGFHLFILA